MAIGTMAAIGIGSQVLSGLVGGLSSMFTAKKQAQEAARIEANNPRPVYKRPQEYGTALDITEQLAYSPNFAGRGYMEEQVGANTANTLRAINEMGLGGAEGTALMSNIYGQEQEGRQEIGVMGAEQQNQGLLQLLQQLQIGAGYSDQEFDINKQQPYEQGAAAASALRGASMANKDVGRSSITNTLGSVGYGLMTSGLGKKGIDSTGTEVTDVVGKYGTNTTTDLFKPNPFGVPSNTLGINQNELLGLSNLLKFYR
jgi:hypothetical protein